MTVAAAEAVYRQEFVLTFEKRVSLLRDTVNTQTMQSGLSVTFPIGGQAARPVTRGANGRIPGAPPNTEQKPVQLEEWHYVPEITDFDAFASQGNQRALMNVDAMQAINWKIDDQIINAAAKSTINTGAAVPADPALVGKAKTILGNAKVPWNMEIYGVITPAFDELLERVPAYASADYVDSKPLAGTNNNAFEDRPKFKVWRGVKWIVHPELPGVGTANETCFMYHSVYAAADLLLNAGVVIMNHDASGVLA